MGNDIKVIHKASDLLHCLIHGAKGLMEIAELMGNGKGTTHRLLNSLKNTGLVAQNPKTKKYLLGPGFILLQKRAGTEYDALLAAAEAPMEHLREIFNETIELHVPVGGYRLCIAECASTQLIRFTSGIGVKAPIYTGSAGKVLLAYMDEKARGKLLQDIVLVKVADNTITDKKVLDQHIQNTITNGYAVSFGERANGAAGISIPILSTGIAIASLSVLSPQIRVDMDKLISMIPEMTKAAKTIEHAFDAYTSNR